jgi:hypothetical protein
MATTAKCGSYFVLNHSFSKNPGGPNGSPGDGSDRTAIMKIPDEGACCSFNYNGARSISKIYVHDDYTGFSTLMKCEPCGPGSGITSKMETTITAPYTKEIGRQKDTLTCTPPPANRLYGTKEIATGDSGLIDAYATCVAEMNPVSDVGVTTIILRVISVNNIGLRYLYKTRGGNINTGTASGDLYLTVSSGSSGVVNFGYFAWFGAPVIRSDDSTPTINGSFTIEVYVNSVSPANLVQTFTHNLTYCYISYNPANKSRVVSGEYSGSQKLTFKYTSFKVMNGLTVEPPKAGKYLSSASSPNSNFCPGYNVPGLNVCNQVTSHSYEPDGKGGFTLSVSANLITGVQMYVTMCPTGSTRCGGSCVTAPTIRVPIQFYASSFGELSKTYSYGGNVTNTYPDGLEGLSVGLSDSSFIAALHPATCPPPP